ncbi:MAG: acyltransferase family protein [Xanthobacteraceae bacterium]
MLSAQLLRAGAALSIVVFHAVGYTKLVGGADYQVGILQAGIDVFFVLSGFIMTYISWERFGSRTSSFDFLFSRIIRIVPLYWALTTLHIAQQTYPPKYILGSYLFVWRWSPPIVGVGWTLNFEMMFYAIFAIGLLLPRTFGIALTGLALLFIHHSQTPFFSDPRIFQFAFGMIIGIAFRCGLRFPAAVRGALIFAGVAGLTYFSGAYWWLGWGAPASLIVAGAVLGNPIPLNWLTMGLFQIGNASYALYLLHPEVMDLVSRGFLSRGISADGYGIALIISMTLVAVMVAVAFHRVVEAPSLAFAKNLQRSFLQRRSNTSSAEGAKTSTPTP